MDCCTTLQQIYYANSVQLDDPNSYERLASEEASRSESQSELASKVASLTVNEEKSRKHVERIILRGYL